MTLTHLPGVPYGAVPRAASPGFATNLIWPPRLVVIHATDNDATAKEEANFAATRTDPRRKWTSAHFYVDTKGVLGSVPLNVKAWAAFADANSRGWHIEMCGRNAGENGAVPPATIAITAALTRQLCELIGIPKVHLGPAESVAGNHGITGHWDVTQGLQRGTHNDPGPAFDWPAFIAMVNEEDDVLTPDQESWLRETHERLGRALAGLETATIRGAVQQLPLVTTIKALATAAAANETRDRATLAAIEALAEQVNAAGGDADAETVLRRIDEAAAQTVRLVDELRGDLTTAHDLLATSESERRELREKLDEALRGQGGGVVGAPQG